MYVASILHSLITHLYAHVATINTSANCTEGDIRLYGSAQPNEGMLHVCVDGVWSTVCHHYWDIRDTNVACYELGYTAYGKLILVGSDNTCIKT